MGMLCLEVADFPEVARVRRKLSTVLVEGIMRDHHVEGSEHSPSVS